MSGSSGSTGKLITLLVIFSKSTKLIKVVKSAKVMQPLVSFLSMALSVFAYSFALGFWFSAGFVAMLFVHELGHVAALRRKKIKASLPIFIPMLGAAVFAPKMDRRQDEAYMAFAGPLIGTAGAIVLLGIAMLFPNPPVLLTVIVFTAFFVNLFNLIPVSPLDGGRVTQAIGPAFKYVGVALLFVLTLMLQTPGMLLIWIVLLQEARLTRFARATLGWSLMALMIFMMVAEVGTPQPFWIDVIDVILAAILNLMYTYIIPSTTGGDLRPQLPPSERRRWFALYAGLAATLVLLTLYSSTLLPPEALS